jgi:hypothetical protein
VRAPVTAAAGPARRATAALALLALAACGSSGDDDARGDDDSGGATTAPTTATTAATTTTAAPTTTTTFPTAADGTDVQACYDGQCDVQVAAGTRIALDPAVGVATAVVNAVTPQGVDMLVTGPSGSMMRFVAAPGAGPGSVMNDVQFQARGISGDQAVIVLAPAPPRPPTTAA